MEDVRARQIGRAMNVQALTLRFEIQGSLDLDSHGQNPLADAGVSRSGMGGWQRRVRITYTSLWSVQCKRRSDYTTEICQVKAARCSSWSILGCASGGAHHWSYHSAYETAFMWTAHSEPGAILGLLNSSLPHHCFSHPWNHQPESDHLCSCYRDCFLT